MEYDDLEISKKIRMSLNGDYTVKPTVDNITNDYSSHHNFRRSDSFHVQSNYDACNFPLNHTNEHNDINTNYKTHNGHGCDDFRQPMPPVKNGSNRVPALALARGQAFDGTSLFRRNYNNKPQQTITPHYNRFGKPSELSNFKSIPDLYPISALNRSNVSYASQNLTNGYSQPLSTPKRNAHDTYVPSGLHRSNSLTQSFAPPPPPPLALPSSALKGDRSNLFLNSYLNKKSTSTNTTMGSKSNLTSYNNDPPKNLSRSRYQDMLKMVPGFEFLSKSKKNAVNDSSIQSGYIDLSSDTDLQASTSSVPSVARVNSLKTRLETKEVFAKADWEQSINQKYNEKSLERRDPMRQLNQVSEECEEKTRVTAARLQEKFNEITISSLIYDDEEEEVTSIDYPDIKDKQKEVVHWISARDTQTVLISKFNLSVTRRDIQTLQWNPLTWLNDEVINFFMELLAERSRLNEKLPKVHAMNTFFLKRLMENGYSGVRRWTRKVDIFAHDIIPVPVHKGIHWCMAIIHLKNKTINYYDSMGTPNNPVLTALANYLKEESLDKKKCEFDMTGWKFDNVRNIPQQENGSDCGVFSCMYAEFITRNRPIVFTQQHMQYFRMKMVYEICKGQMLN